MVDPAHALNWQAGWPLVLAAFVTGALIGRAFHRHDFLGGYGSFRRRLLRLGHIAGSSPRLLSSTDLRASRARSRDADETS